MAVRGTFDLNERPATEALRRISREGERTDVTMRKLGKTVDDTFGAKNLEEAKAYEKQLGRDRREAKALVREMERLSAMRATPEVHVRGLDTALAKTELLIRRLAVLDGKTVAPNVGLGAVPAATRASGGGSSFGAGGLRIPLAGRVPTALIAAGLAATPPLVGGAGALLGSAGAGTLGLGALGLTGMGVGAAAGGLAAPTSIVAAKQMAESSDALKKFREEVLQTGPASKASLLALREYRQTLEGAPRGTAQFLRARTALGSEFGNATGPGQASVARIATRGINLGRQLTPAFGAASNRFLGEAQQQGDKFADFLADPRSRDFYRAMSREATADLSILEGTSENVLRSIENIARAGRPFFHEGMVFLEDWTEGWKKSTNDLQGTRDTIGGFVDDLKAWGRLGSASLDLGGDLLGAGRKPGRSLVTDLTGQLQEWDRWIERNPRKVNQFFREAVRGTKEIAGAVGDISQMLWGVGQHLSPLITQGTKLVSLLDNAGLLTPGGLPFLIAGGAGIRNTMGGARGRMLGGGAGAGAAGMGMPLILGGGGGAGGGAGRGGAFGRIGGAIRSPGYGYGYSTVEGQSAWNRNSRLGAGLRATGREFGPTAGRFARGFGARIGPLMALSAGLGFLTSEGNLGERGRSTLSQATFGLIPAPPTMDQRFATGFEDARSGFGSALASKRRAARRTFGGPHGEFYSNMIPAAAREAGQAPGYFRYRQSHPLPLNYAVERLRGTDTGTPQGQGEAAFLQAQIEKIKGAQAARAGGFVEDIRGAARVEINHGAKGARSSAIGNIADRLGDINDPRTAKLFGAQGLGLARQMARENPKLKGAVDQLASSIEQRFAEMGRKVQVIHGNIVDVSASSWDQVAKAADSKTQQALASASKNLTALEHRAMAVLRNMGFSPGVARQLAQQSLQGGEAGALADSAANAGTATAEVNGKLDPHFKPGHKTTRHGATGMRIPGRGLHDTVDLGGGNMVAPGETLIYNRHTERKIDRMLAPMGTTLAREIGREGRAHSEPFRTFSATGSILPAGKMAQAMGLKVSQGPGYGGTPSGGHAPTSLHYSGLAYDISGSAQQMWAYRRRAEKAFRGSINELFYDPYPYYIDNGQKVPGAIGGHSDHVHIGFMGGGAKGAAGVGHGRAVGAGHPQIKLRGMKSGVGGLTGLIADHANQAIAGGMSRNLNRMVAGRGGRGGGMPGGLGGGPAENMALARSMLGGFGWGRGEWPDLKALWQQESGWDAGARNPSSGAYGIPQSLPASKMGPEAQGSGPAAARAQILWGLKYIKDRYGSPSAAWSFHQGHNWYSRGGRVPGMAGWFKNGGHFRVKNPTMFGAGEGGVTEDVHITPMGRGRKGGAGGGVTIPVTIGTVIARDPSEARNVGRNIAKGIAAELAGALNGSDGVSDREVG